MVPRHPPHTAAAELPNVVDRVRRPVPNATPQQQHQGAQGQPGGQEQSGSGQEADERVHGLVPRSTSQDGARKSKDAQLRDLETARHRVEDPFGGREEAVHRRGQATPGVAHEGAP